MEYAEHLFTGVGAVVVDLVTKAAYAAVVAVGAVVAFAALIWLLRTAADRLFAEGFLGKGEVIAKEIVPGYVAYGRAFGPVPNAYSATIPQQFRVEVRTTHGTAMFPVPPADFEAITVGDHLLVSLARGRYSGRAYPRKIYFRVD